MSRDPFDTLDTSRDLEAAGIERPQAEAIARAIARTGERLATKHDLERHEASTKTGAERSESTIKAGFERFQSTMQAASSGFNPRCRPTSSGFTPRCRPISNERFQAVTKADLANLRADMYRALWIQGVGIVAIVTALEFLP